MQVRWIIMWFLYYDYCSGEMIRTWLQINGFLKIENVWKNYMIRKINGLHKRSSK